MTPLTKFIKTGLVAVCAAISLNYATNIMLADKIKTQTQTVQNQARYLSEHKNMRPDLTSILQKSSDAEKKDIQILTPFWDMQNISLELKYRIENQSGVIQDDGARVVYLGIGYEKRLPKIFLEDFSSANFKLEKYGIRLFINEEVDVDLPHEFNDGSFCKGINGSFKKPIEYAIVMTSKNYSRGKYDYSISSSPKDRVTLIDEIDDQKLDDIIVYEMLRLFSNSENAKAESITDPTYLKDINNQVIEANLGMTFLSEAYDLTINRSKKRTATINVALDNVSLEEATRLLSKASETYETKFGITLETIGFYEHKLPKNWELEDEGKNLKAKSDKKSDIYLILTDTNWSTSTNKEGSTAGQANSREGYVWAETCHDEHDKLHILLHEIGHIFGAEHIYKRGALMHPSINELGNWEPDTESTILKNKYAKWE